MAVVLTLPVGPSAQPYLVAAILTLPGVLRLHGGRHLPYLVAAILTLPGGLCLLGGRHLPYLVADILTLPGGLRLHGGRHLAYLVAAILPLPGGLCLNGGRHLPYLVAAILTLPGGLRLHGGRHLAYLVAASFFCISALRLFLSAAALFVSVFGSDSGGWLLLLEASGRRPTGAEAGARNWKGFTLSSGNVKLGINAATRLCGAWCGGGGAVSSRLVF